MKYAIIPECDVFTNDAIRADFAARTDLGFGMDDGRRMNHVEIYDMRFTRPLDTRAVFADETTIAKSSSASFMSSSRRPALTRLLSTSNSIKNSDSSHSSSTMRSLLMKSRFDLARQMER